MNASDIRNTLATAQSSHKVLVGLERTLAALPTVIAHIVAARHTLESDIRRMSAALEKLSTPVSAPATVQSPVTPTVPVKPLEAVKAEATSAIERLMKLSHRKLAEAAAQVGVKTHDGTCLMSKATIAQRIVAAQMRTPAKVVEVKAEAKPETKPMVEAKPAVAAKAVAPTTVAVPVAKAVPVAEVAPAAPVANATTVQSERQAVIAAYTAKFGRKPVSGARTDALRAELGMANGKPRDVGQMNKVQLLEVLGKKCDLATLRQIVAAFAS